MSVKLSPLTDYFSARNHVVLAPDFMPSMASYSRSPWQDVLPLVDDRGFLITLIPDSHKIYRKMQAQWMGGYPNKVFEIAIYSGAMDLVPVYDSVQEAHYHKMYFELRVLHPRHRDGADRDIYILTTRHLCEELFADGTLPDLRGVFR